MKNDRNFSQFSKCWWVLRLIGLVFFISANSFAEPKVDAGFVYLTDALTSNQVEVALILPDNTHTPIIFPGAIITSSQHIDLAKAFLAFLQSKESRAIFATYGFTE